MKSYPSIPTVWPSISTSRKKKDQFRFNASWIGFDKLDGSIIRAEWSKKKGFYKFGRKHGLLDHSNPVLLEASSLVERNYGFLSDTFGKKGWPRVVAFFEFLGKNSFAGSHEDEEHSVHLIDLAIYRKGLLDPEELAAMNVPGASQVVHRGIVSFPLLMEIHHGELEGVTLEGVVFKRTNEKGRREMFKTKSHTWYTKLHKKVDGDPELYERLR